MVIGFRGNEGPVTYSTSADPVPGEPDGFLPIMFPHIPRTAGFTLKALLQSIFGMRRSLLDVHFYDVSNEDLTRYALIEGHRISGFFERSFGPSWHTNAVTVLREPVDRVVSQARHIRSLPGDRRHDVVKGKVRDPADVFERIPHLSNLQTKMLGDRLADGIVDPTALDDAKALLDRVAFGVTEAVDVSVALFAERFALDLPTFGRRNVSPESGDEDLCSEEFRAAALAHNVVDRQLYEYASRLFEQRTTSYAKNLLELDCDQGRLECWLGARHDREENCVRLPPHSTTARLRGPVLVDGRAPDAVLVSVEGKITPVAARVHNPGTRLDTDLGHRYASIAGRVDFSSTAQDIEVIAFDRSRRVRADQTIAIARDGSARANVTSRAARRITGKMRTPKPATS